MPDAEPSKPVPPRTRNRVLIAVATLALLAICGVVWLQQRPELQEPGSLIPAANADRPAQAARFATPAGAVTVLVTPPRAQVEAPDYGSEAPRIGWGDRFVGIDVRAPEAARPQLELALVADGRRYRLDAARDDDYWLVLDGAGDELTVELSYDGDPQRVELGTGEREVGLAGALAESYAVTSCSVTARDPGGVVRPVHQFCPELIVNVSTWDAERGWVREPGQRWVSVAPAPYSLVQRIGTWRSLDTVSGGDLTVNGEVSEPGERGSVALVDGTPEVVEIQYRARPYDGGTWNVVVRAEIEEVAR